MNESIEMEIVRLVKEIAEDELELISAERLLLDDKIKRYTNAMNRKLDLIKILKDRS